MPIGALFAFIGTVFAVLSKYLGDILAESVKHATGWQAWLKKILARTALWFAAVIVPLFLWLLYLQLTYFGLSNSDGTFPYAPRWPMTLAHAAPFQGVWQKAGMTVTAVFYLEAFFIAGIVALYINPNVTSLYRLYRDRLSKAFLFDPDPWPRDKYGDLQAYEPKLHQIDTNLCPYPIVNASLNIEGSQYANKRGRNADFFVFTPEYIGSDATGYIGTRRIENEEASLDLGTAMAVSGAGVSSNMGTASTKLTKLLSVSLALL